MGMFDASIAFAYSNDDTCVLFSGFAYWVMLMSFVLLLSFRCCPQLLSLRLSRNVFRTLLFNIFVPLVLNFSTFCASFLFCCHCSICCCCFCCCWCYYVRAKLLVKCLSGAESLTQFSLAHCICMTHTQSETERDRRSESVRSAERGVSWRGESMRTVFKVLFSFTSNFSLLTCMRLLSLC